MDQKVLVLAAHPDDEVLGCGGTIARLASEGAEVHVAILGEGITSRNENPDDADPALIRRLHESSRKAADLLGVRSHRIEDLPDNRFDTVPLLEIVKRIEGHVVRTEADTVYTQHGGDLNVDHSILFRATLTATRPMPGSTVRELYAYPVASSSEWSFARFAPAFEANTFMDISRTLDDKLAALRMYEAEMREFPHPRSEEAIRAGALLWGSVLGVDAAEPFVQIRRVL